MTNTKFDVNYSQKILNTTRIENKMSTHNILEQKNTKEIMSQKILSNVIDKIKITRKTLGVSQIDLSKETGFSPSYLCRLEKRNRKMSLEMAIKICYALHINLDEIIKSSH